MAGLDYLAGCILEAMRLWPTTPCSAGSGRGDVSSTAAEVLPAGTQVLIHNVFNHRNRDRVPFADRFAPGEWASGDAATSWPFNFFSHGPQGCPGAGLAIFLGQAFLARLLACWTPSSTGRGRSTPVSRCPTGSTSGVSIELNRRK